MRARGWTITAVAGLLLAGCLAWVVARPDGSATAAAAPPAHYVPAPPPATTTYPVPPGAVFVAVTGNDAATGTQAAPLATLAAAIQRAPAGGTILLRGGTYRQTVGSVRKPVTIEPYPGEQVWLKGTTVLTGWQRSGSTWRHTGWTDNSCQTCVTPAIIDPRYPYAGRPELAFLDGTPLRQVGSASAVTPGTFYPDRAGHALVIGANPAGRTIEASAFDRLIQFDHGAEGSVVRGLDVSEYATNQDYGNHGAMIVVNAANVTLDHDTFAWSASAGAAVFQPGGTVTGSTFDDNGLVGVVANRADGLRLTGNQFTANNQEHFALSGDAVGAAGAKITRTKRPYVSDNHFTANIGSGWWCDLGCTDATVVRNIATGNQVNGLFYEVSARAIIASNVVAGNTGQGVKISSCQNVTLAANTFDGNGTELGLYNDPRSPGFDPYSQKLGLTWVTSGTVVLDNLFAEPVDGTAIVVATDYKNPPTPAAFVARADGDAYLRADSGATEFIWSLGHGNTGTYATLSALHNATHQEPHGLAAPLPAAPFTDPARGDYRLRPGTPGIAAGVPLPAATANAIGVPVTPHPTIGALRFPA